jgi:hypothetical protein
MMYYWIRIFYQPKKYAQQLDGPLYADLCRQFTMDDCDFWRTLSFLNKK